MPKFGKKSKKRLIGVDAKLVSVLNESIKHFDFTVIEGVRSLETHLPSTLLQTMMMKKDLSI
jgi:hypothetical protein